MRTYTKIALLFGFFSLVPCVYAQEVGQKKTPALVSEITYTTESPTGRILLNVNKKEVHIYDQAVVKYGTMELRAGAIDIQFRDHLLTAYYKLDSAGRKVQMPLFQDGEQKLVADTLRYNFLTGRGWIKQATTQESGGFLTGSQAKMISDSSYYLSGMAFTTCNHEIPHFAIRTRKAKLDIGKRIVTGPAYLELAHLPTPLALPFAYFPMQEKKASGFILPNFSDRQSWGLGLTGLGYYFVLNDYMDLRVTGDIYSQGSFALRANSSYKVRYKYSGSFAFSTNHIQFGDPRFAGTSLYQNSTDFGLGWTHNQDPKARPDFRFTSKVDLATGGYYKNTSTDPSSFLKNDLSSSISATKTFLGTPFVVSMAARHRQNNQKKTLTLNLPEVNVSMARIQPFKSAGSSKIPMWIQGIGLNYQWNARNETRGTTDQWLEPSSLFAEDNVNWGAQHSSSLSTNAKVARFITLSPSASFSERWYPSRLNYLYDEPSQTVRVDTVKGFFASRDFSANASLSTTVYGLFQFSKGPIAAIRHVIYPSIGLRISPDFTDPYWGSYQSVQTDSTGKTQLFSRFSGANYLYGTAAEGGGSSVGFRLRQVIEGKWRPQDSAEAKKFPILEDVSMEAQFNPSAEVFRWSTFRTRASTSFLKNTVRMSYQGEFDPYGMDSLGVRQNISAWEYNHLLVRPMTQSFSTDFRWRGGSSKGRPTAPLNEAGLERDLFMDPYGINDFYTLHAPWTVSGSYTYRYSPAVGLSPAKTTQAIRFDAAIEPTANWRMALSSGYDLMERRVTMTSVDVTRTIHCWDLRIRWVPFGYNRSYVIGLGAKAPLFRDLKVERRRGRGDY